MEVVEKIALISINETLVIQLLSFLIFLFIINRLMFRPLNGIMAEREKVISNAEDEIRANLAQMSAMQKELAKNEALARADAAAIRAEMARQSDDQAKQIFVEARDEIAKLRQQSALELEAEYARSLQSLEEEARAVSVLMVEQVLQRRSGLS
ncbi:MAG: ATP synthase F0 subunit B [Desulfatibacillaceae bacterium]|nr:ATP synthase F0 subunit B [Desulfatibacillaceae bacterium]